AQSDPRSPARRSNRGDQPRTSLLIQLFYPVGRVQNLAEHRRLRDQDRIVQVLVGNLARVVSNREGAGGVGEKLHFVAAMESVARRAVATHLRHVTGDSQSVDLILAQPLLQVGAGEARGQGLIDQQVGG